MAFSKDLFLAILSMDAYNRGYNPGLLGLSQAANTFVGNARIISNAQDNEGIAQAAGFYAVAYDMTGVRDFASGEKVISYRGTDWLR